MLTGKELLQQVPLSEWLLLVHSMTILSFWFLISATREMHVIFFTG